MALTLGTLTAYAWVLIALQEVDPQPPSPLSVAFWAQDRAILDFVEARAVVHRIDTSRLPKVGSGQRTEFEEALHSWALDVPLERSMGARASLPIGWLALLGFYADIVARDAGTVPVGAGSDTPREDEDHEPR